MDAPGTIDRTDSRLAPPLVGGICELTVQAEDVDALVGFYARAFGLDVIAREDDRTWLACGVRVRLGIWTPGVKEFGDRGGRHVHFAFSAGPRQLDALTARLAAAGIGYRGPVEHPGGDRSIYVEDPEGNVVEIWDFFEHGEGAAEGVGALA